MPYYRLQNYQREDLRRPLGVLISNGDLAAYLKEAVPSDATVVTVGDRTTEYFVTHGWRPSLQIVDTLEKRARRTAPVGGFDRMTSVSNPAGGISSEAMELVRTELANGGASRILVVGEEDLLLLPVLVFAADGTDVFYGQPNEGMVHVKVSPQTRKRAVDVLSVMGYQAPMR
ncbi:MAG TPA: GTP-dependent dephospho-CoA kinase family protein [Conexivisphaerales archaeon]|nr:GTP-dependent dephospho-CoA kinase family protein [Conexivisphaerales archaeon]